MNKKLVSALLGFGIAIGSINIATAYPSSCIKEHIECIEQTQNDRYCEDRYKRCMGY